MFLQVPGQASGVRSALALVPKVAPRGSGFARGAWPFIGQLPNPLFCVCVRACVRACVYMCICVCMWCVHAGMCVKITARTLYNNYYYRTCSIIHPPFLHRSSAKKKGGGHLIEVCTNAPSLHPPHPTLQSGFRVTVMLLRGSCRVSWLPQNNNYYSTH